MSTDAGARLQRRRRRIAMTADERDAFLAQTRVARVATIRADGSPDVTPLWFVWFGGSVWVSSLVQSQRWTNLERDPRVSLVVDDGDDYTDLRGVELSGLAVPVGEQPRDGRPVEALIVVEASYATKYGIEPGSLYDGRHAWIRVDVTGELSWDHRKIRAAPPQQAVEDGR